MNNPYLDSKQAIDYDSKIKTNFILRKIRFQEKQILDRLFIKYLKTKDNILEIGAGTGYYSIDISKKVKSVTALEPSLHMRNILKDKIKKNKIKNLKIIDNDFLQPKFKEKFDHVICIGVLDYVSQAEKFINKCLSLAKKTVIITTPNKGLWATLYEGLMKFYDINIYSHEKNKIKSWLKNCDITFYEAGFGNKIIKGLTLIIVIEKRMING